MSKCQYEINMDLPPTFLTLLKRLHYLQRGISLTMCRSIIRLHTFAHVLCPGHWQLFLWCVLTSCHLKNDPLQDGGKWNKEHQRWQIKNACSDLIFVTNISKIISGEKIVKWRNFSFSCMTIVGKLKISPHVEEFQMSPLDICGEIWNSPIMACV